MSAADSLGYGLQNSKATPAGVEDTNKDRFEVLDGWRALSIILVLAGHLLPLSMGIFQMNASIAATGMVLFFTLSGFLITRSLQKNSDIRSFIIRRVFRIVPLSWLAMIILLIINKPLPNAWAANLLFYANIIPGSLMGNGGGHLWSLCVEMQMYILLAALVAVFSRSGLAVIPLLALGVTASRISNQAYIDIATWYRCDELLAGSVLALLYSGRYGEVPKRVLIWLNPFWLFPLLVFSAHPLSGFVQYIRPYVGAAIVGATLYSPPPIITRVSRQRVVTYLAEISYALYIIHGVLTATWLASGDRTIKYLKRPLLIAVTFGLAHLSTFQFENRFIAYAKRHTRRG